MPTIELPFCFLDNQLRPYSVRKWGGTVWLFYWGPEDNWVSLRALTDIEVEGFAMRRLPNEQMKLYDDRAFR